MRDTIDFGIDLGTTNSAIAVARGGEVSVIKNNDGWDYTPSAVWMPKPGAKRVGGSARERAWTDPENAHAEFKLEMGLDGIARTFRNAGISMTPQQLSAEVLKSLRDNATSLFGEPPQATVITVPAAFRLHQNNATSAAAALAGFGTCPLVQEPTAAAFAYGFLNQANEAYWMVFDFGGGTFDAAVVTTHEGELRVLDHAGNPHLGGRLIDWAIVERVLAPAAARELQLTDFTRENPHWRRNFVLLKLAAEEAKISLSRVENFEVLVDLEVAGGTKEPFEYALRRDELDVVAEPYYLQAINLCRDALGQANLNPGDIDRLLLVGAATLAPGLRERLADPTSGLGIQLDHSHDPSTVVARGAAVFASTVPLPRSKVPPKEGEFSVDLRYPRTTSLPTAVVQGKFESTTRQAWAQYHVVLDNPDGKPPFRSEQVTLDEQGTFATEVRVDERTTSTFALLLVDSAGRRMKVTSGSLSITHLVNELGRPVLTNSIGLSEADMTFTPILQKGASLPAKQRGTFCTTVALHRSDTDAVIRIPIVEGDRARADRNLQVGLIEIRPKDVRIDLPKGSDVEVTIEVDESRRVTVVADVPMIDAQFEADIDLSHVRPPDASEMERELLDLDSRLKDLRESVERSGSARARERLEQLDAEQRVTQAGSEVRAGRNDKGSAAAAGQQLRDAQAELDEVEKEIQIPAKLMDLNAEMSECREFVRRWGDAADRAELAEIERRAEQLRSEPDLAAIKKLIGRVAELQITLMRREGTLDITVFYYFRDNQDKLTSPEKARALIAEGEQAIARQDWHSLPGINERLRRLRPANLPGPSQGGVISPGRELQ